MLIRPLRPVILGGLPAIVAVFLTVPLLVVLFTFGMLIQSAIVIDIALVIFLMVARPSAMHVGIAVALYMFAHSEASRDNEVVGVVARILALAVVLIAVSRCRRDSQRVQPWEFSALILLSSLAYLTAMLTHGFTSAAIIDLTSLALSCICLFEAFRYLPRELIRAGVELAIFLAVGTSLALAFALPGFAFEGVRLEGLFVNANTLGFFAALGLLLGVLGDGRRFRFALMVVSGVTLVMTGSRSALLALTIAMLLTSLRVVIRRDKGTLSLIAMTAVGSTAGYFLLSSSLSTEMLILRDNDSRSTGSDYALEIASQHLWRGIGYGQSQIEIANTPLRWLAETGLVGFLCVIVAYIVILTFAWRRSWQAFLVATFGVVSSLFEGWYFAGGSGLFFTYWFVYVCAAGSSSHPLHREGADTTKSAGLQRSG